MDVALPEPVKAEPAHDLAVNAPAGSEFAEPAVEAAATPLAWPGMAVRPTPGKRKDRRLVVQPKLAVGACDDPLEVEADVVAQRVVDVLRGQRSDPVTETAEVADPDVVERRLDVMRQAGSDEPVDSEPGANLAAMVRRHADVLRHADHWPSTSIGAEGGDLSEGLESSLRRETTGGSALPAPARRQMESALGVDFGDVRVHSGPRATALNEQMSARAFTVDNHLFFRDGLPDTSSADGQHLLAHELAHTIQQSPSPARRSTIRRDGDGYGSGSGSGSGTAVLDESAETESEEPGTGKGSGVMFMDPSGVGHKEPDKSKAPDVLFMDPSGVGHKEPDKVKKSLPSVMFMDPSGVGHKEPEKVSTPSVLQMDDKGVGNAKADNQEVAGAQNVLRGARDNYMQRVNTITDAGTKWDGFKKTALKGEQDALAALTAGQAVWDAEKADSGLIAATQAELATTASTSATKANDDAKAIAPGFETAWDEMVKRNKNLEDNTASFAKNKARWLKSPTPATKIAVDEIQAMVDQQAQGRKAAEAVEKDCDATLAEIDRAAAAAAKSATDAGAPLAKGGTIWVITGLMQQKLNQANTANGGQRISVTALFDPGTEAALKQFQGDNGLPVTGIADVATWTALDKAAPSEIRNGELRVEDEDKAETVKPIAGIHPELSFPTYGAAVRELQERLNNWQKTVVGKKPFSIMSVDGIFGVKTRFAVKDFQKAHGLPENATADDATWAELDKVGAVSAGVRQLSWDQIVEGNRSGMESKYRWEVTKDNRLVITVEMNFTGEKKHPKVAQWVQDIKDVWNGFKAVEDGGARSFDIEFNPVLTSGGHKIRVGKPTPTNPNPRSDAANWYVNDNRKGLAPHEFGHLIGLADEYNRPEEQYVESTGQEPSIGSMGTSGGLSTGDLVTLIHDAIANNARGPAVSTAVAKVVTDQGITPGAVARLVAQEYVKQYPYPQDFLDSIAGSRVPATFTTYLKFAGGGKYTGDLTTATAAFSESNTSIMGTMQSVPQTDAAGIAAIAPHDHPVQPRHLRSFVDLLVVAMPGSKWKTEKR